MPSTSDRAFVAQFVSDLDHDGSSEFDGLPGWLFKNFVCYIDIPEPSASPLLAESLFEFAGGKISKGLSSLEITHIVVSPGDLSRLRAIRESIQWRQKIPRVVTTDWVEESLKAQTLLDEERFAPVWNQD
ncbi:DNA ligase (ATP) [Maublancomyces gigas]|uniref:DNA ligase (ATP) n=1 Tax=Discina gigas TaxID=1032678 RepID=A0ABR3GUE0_9PEZI